jgi:hypothetical protein
MKPKEQHTGYRSPVNTTLCPDHRKPAELHILNGSYEKNPNRNTKGIVKSPEVPGKAAKYFDADELVCWKQLRVMAAIYSCVSELSWQLYGAIAPQSSQPVSRRQTSQLSQCHRNDTSRPIPRHRPTSLPRWTLSGV